MKKFSLIVIGTLLFFLYTPVFAAGYGAAGCGLGSMVFGSGSGPKQIFAATTNGTFGSQTFGISSGTSNCGDHGLINISKEREVFAQQNYTSLVKEMAQGEGESLYTLASLYQCPAETHQAFGTMTQDKFDRLVANSRTTPIELLTLIEEEMTRNPKLASSCDYVLTASN
jgi:DUF3015 family protein